MKGWLLHMRREELDGSHLCRPYVTVSANLVYWLSFVLLFWDNIPLLSFFFDLFNVFLFLYMCDDIYIYDFLLNYIPNLELSPKLPTRYLLMFQRNISLLIFWKQSSLYFLLNTDRQITLTNLLKWHFLKD